MGFQGTFSIESRNIRAPNGGLSASFPSRAVKIGTAAKQTACAF
jgi:hypothetical protein